MTRAVEPGADTPAHIPRWPEVQARTGLSRSTIYRRLAEGSGASNGDKEQTMASLSRTGRVVARTALALWLLFPGLLWAQGTSPWVEAVNELQAQFTGPIARGLSLIAIVVGGLMFAFGEGGSKRTLAGIIFGLGMAMGAANFLAWLF